MSGNQHFPIEVLLQSVVEDHILQCSLHMTNSLHVKHQFMCVQPKGSRRDPERPIIIVEIEDKWGQLRLQSCRAKGRKKEFISSLGQMR